MIANLLSKIGPFHLIRQVHTPRLYNFGRINKLVLLQNRIPSCINRCSLLAVVWVYRPTLAHLLVVRISFLHYYKVLVPIFFSGVLFSIEVTSTYYPVRNYLLTFQCAVISAIVYQFVRFVRANNLMNEREREREKERENTNSRV